MSRFLFLAGIFGLANALAAVSVPASAQVPPTEEPPLLVTYGPRANSIEGDPNHRQIIILRLPATHTEAAYVRVFDANTGGRHDTPFGRWGDTSMAYRLFAENAASNRSRDPLASVTIGSDRSHDNRWVSLFEIDPATGTVQGLGPDAMRVFQLEIEGVKGNDANLYSVDLSASASEAMPIMGARLLAPGATIRIPELDDEATARSVQMVLDVPPGTKTLKVQNFDAASAEVVLTGPYSTRSTKSSGQGEWARQQIDLSDAERKLVDQGRGTSLGRFALTATGGAESPNDVTVFADDQRNRRVSIELPLRLVADNERPSVNFKSHVAGCQLHSFDGTSSKDPEGGVVNLSWLINGKSYIGPRANHKFAAPGYHSIELVARDRSRIVGDGAILNRAFYVKRPPKAALAAPGLVAAKVEVGFDASASTGDDLFALKAYAFDFGDGTTLISTIPTATHIYSRPGRYQASVTVDDGSGEPCTTATATDLIVVNAAPTAKVTDGDRFVAVGADTVFDGSGSHDPDGTLAAFTWDFGDGTTARGAMVNHAWQTPGLYQVVLGVDDGTNVANNSAETNLRVRVNASPRPQIAAPKNVRVGEVAVFDAHSSVDPDGSILAYDWTINNGDEQARLEKGARIAHSWHRPGTYKVELRIEDASGGPGRFAKASAEIEVAYVPNLAPVADAGPDHRVEVGQSLTLSGARSADPDGNILKYEWDFGDGGTATTRAPVHAWHVPGDYTVSLTVTDDGIPESTKSSDSARVRVVYAANTPPRPVLGPDRRAVVGETVIFDGSRSTDPDGNILKYNWDFGNGRSQSGEVARHVFWQPGTYPVTLSVTDNGIPAPATTEAKMTVVISDANGVELSGDQARGDPQ